MKELVEVELEPGRRLSVGRGLDVKIMAELVSCLLHNIDILAWKVEDMPRIDLTIAVHRLNVNLNARPIKQRKR